MSQKDISRTSDIGVSFTTQGGGVATVNHGNIQRPRTPSSSSVPPSPGSGIMTGFANTIHGSSRSLHDKSHVQDGCLILGKDSADSKQYVTRFRINIQQQRANLFRDLLKEECCPVLEEENRETCCSGFFAFISGESFLLSLHITALLIGVAKEAFEVGEIGTDLEILHSSLETLVAVLQVTIRTVTIRRSRKGIKEAVKPTQHVTGEHSVSGRKLHFLVNSFTAIGCFLVFFAVLCCVIFILIDEMTWTLLSNNFVMIIGTVLSNLLLLRIEKIKSSIYMDQHKAVLYESTLLLEDAVKKHTEKSFETFRNQVDLFLKSILHTDLLAKPEHIELESKYRDKFDIITNLEMMSYQ